MTEPPNVSLNASLKAKLLGHTQGTDVSALGLAGLCLTGAVSCFWLSSHTPWALIGAFAFLGGFSYVLYVWKTGTGARSKAEAPPATLSWKSGDEQLDLSISLDERNYAAKKILSGMRAVIQSRQLPPSPRGAVVGNPADSASLKEYSHGQQQEIEKKWAEEIHKHDEAVVEQLTSTIKVLEADITAADEGPAGLAQRDSVPQ